MHKPTDKLAADILLSRIFCVVCLALAAIFAYGIVGNGLAIVQTSGNSKSEAEGNHEISNENSDADVGGGIGSGVVDGGLSSRTAGHGSCLF